MNKLLSFSILAVIAISISSCATTNKMYLSVKEPANVTLRDEIKSIGVIDRSKTTEANRTTDQFDQILSLEGKKLDSLGRLQQLNTVEEKIQNNAAIEQVVYIPITEYLNENPTGFGVALDQTTVRAICEKYNVQALVSLEYFDTDAKVSFNVRNYQANGPLGIKVPMVEQIVKINTQIKSGWRIYDPLYTEAIDQSHFSIPIVSTGRGISPMVAFNTVKNRESRVMEECRKIGTTQGKRIQAYYVRVSRDYYVSGSNRFKLGKRMAQTGNWDDAREQWKLELTNPKPKLAGRAHYNMAISCEINGFIDDAIDYASKGYQFYNDKLCLKYVKILQARKARLENAERLKK